MAILEFSRKWGWAIKMPSLSPGLRLVCNFHVLGYSCLSLFGKMVATDRTFQYIRFNYGLYSKSFASCHHKGLFNSVSLHQMVQCSLRNSKASGKQKNSIVSFLENIDMTLIISVVKHCSSEKQKRPPGSQGVCINATRGCIAEIQWTRLGY